MVDRGHPGLSVVKQCRLLQLSRSAVYYRPTPTNPADLDLMAGMDRQYLKTPYYGSRRMTAWLRTQGHQVNRKRVRRLMRAMGLEAIYRKPNTSKPASEHRIYPYLLKGVAVDRVNQVWAADITYTCPCPGDSFISWPLWTGTAGTCWLGGSPILCEFSVKDSIVIAHNINLPSIARQAGLDNTIILLQPEHKSRRAAEFESIREISRDFPYFLLILKLPLRNNLRWLHRTLHSARHLFQQNRRQGLRNAFAAVGHAFDMEGLQTRQ